MQCVYRAVRAVSLLFGCIFTFTHGVSPCEIFGEGIGTGIGFSQSPLVFHVSIIPQMLHTHLHAHVTHIHIHRSIIRTRRIEFCSYQEGKWAKPGNFAKSSAPLEIRDNWTEMYFQFFHL